MAKSRGIEGRCTGKRGDAVSCADDILKALNPDETTILHIPNVNSRESTKDKIKEVEHIIETLGTWQGADPATSFQLVKTAQGRGDAAVPPLRSETPLPSRISNVRERSASHCADTGSLGAARSLYAHCPWVDLHGPGFMRQRAVMRGSRGRRASFGHERGRLLRWAGNGRAPARPPKSTPGWCGAARQRGSIHHHIASRYQRSGPVNFDDHAAKAKMDAHRAMNAIRQDGGSIGDMPPMRFDRAPGLPPQGRERSLPIRPCGQNEIREVLMQAYGDLWQDCLLWLKTTEIRASAIAHAFR